MSVQPEGLRFLAATAFALASGSLTYWAIVYWQTPVNSWRFLPPVVYSYLATIAGGLSFFVSLLD